MPARKATIAIAPVHVPGVPTPRAALQRFGHQNARAKANQSGDDRRTHTAHNHRLRRWRIGGVAVAAIHGHGLAIHDSGVVARHVDHVGRGFGDLDGFHRWWDHRVGKGAQCHIGGGHIRCLLGGRIRHHLHLDLIGGLERTRLGGAATHHLNGVEHVGGVVVIGLTECGSPRHIGGQLLQHVWKLRQRLDRWVPCLAVGGIRQRVTLESRVLSHPHLGRAHLIGIGRSGQNESHQLVGIERNRCHHLVEDIGRWRRVADGGGRQLRRGVHARRIDSADGGSGRVAGFLSVALRAVIAGGQQNHDG